MHVIIAGSRDITDYKLLEQAVINSKFSIDTVISGGARGVDRLGEIFAKQHNCNLVIMRPDWDKYKKSAGYIRNSEMANKAAATGKGGLIAIWDGKSRGTKHMIDTATTKNLMVYVYII